MGTAMVDQMTAESPADEHDHRWRRNHADLTSSHGGYRCELCSLTWSGYVPTIHEDGLMVLRRG